MYIYLLSTLCVCNIVFCWRYASSQTWLYAEEQRRKEIIHHRPCPQSRSSPETKAYVLSHFVAACVSTRVHGNMNTILTAHAGSLMLISMNITYLQRFYGVTAYTLGICRQRASSGGGALSVHGNALPSVQGNRAKMRSVIIL